MNNKGYIKIYIIAFLTGVITLLSLHIIDNTKSELITQIEKQIKTLKMPVPFVYKTQFFFDKAMTYYEKKDIQNSILNLKISESFINALNTKINKKVYNLIENTIKQIKKHQKIDTIKKEEELYDLLVPYSNNYYRSTQDTISKLYEIIDNTKKFSMVLTFTIILFAISLITIIIFYQLKIHFEKNSLTDPLTQTKNRRSFFKDIVKLKPSTHTLVMTDIDHFKQINDTYGHDMGDFVLKEFTKLIKNNIRKDDLIYRWGGEEFIIILKNVDKNQAKIIIENLRQKIESHNFNGIHITASFGIKEIDGMITEDDLREVDKALYISKETGRNKVTVIN